MTGIIGTKRSAAGGRYHSSLLRTTGLTLLLASGVALPVQQALADPIVVSGEQDISGQTISYTGGGVVDTVKVNPGATLTGTNVIITGNGTFTSSGQLAAGIRAGTGSTVNLTGGSISATGPQFTRGILGGGAGTTISTNGTDISTTGNNSHGVHATDGAKATVEGGTVSTQGSDSFGLYSQNANSHLAAENVTINTTGLNGFGAFAYGPGVVELNNSTITTTGLQGHGAVAGQGSTVEVNGTQIETSGDYAWGLVADQANTSIIATGADIVTNGLHSYGVRAAGANPASIVLTGGSVRTANATGQGTQDGDGSRGYALVADGAGASITADGTRIETVGQRAYGAYAINGGKVWLDDLDIATEGFMAYGVYASGADSVLTANGVNVTTTGDVGDAAWAYNGGRIELTGGTYDVRGGQNSNTPGETANGLVALGGTQGTNNGTISADGVTVTTAGNGSIGLLAGGEVGTDRTSGTITFANGSVTVSGADGNAARVLHGSTLNATNSSLVSTQGAGVVLTDNATVTLDGTSVSAKNETFVSNLVTAGQAQNITVQGTSVATQNNGTLLLVNRSVDGGNGVVNLVLDAGSTTRGNIRDENVKTGGTTNVWVSAQASWIGQLFGVTNFFGGSGGTVSFEDGANIAGDLTGEGTTYTFSEQGGQIGGDVTLTQGSTTRGGSVDAPIQVSGHVEVDETSTFGGNWDIDGNLDSSGLITPGNSIGVVNVGGNLNLYSDSVYAVELNSAGESDRINVGGTANLAGRVTVAPIDYYVLDQDYTILTAAALSGSFDGGVAFVDDYAFLAPTLRQDGTTVYVRVARNGVDYASVAQTANQAAVAAAAGTLPLGSEVGGALAVSTVTQAQAAFQQLSGEVYASAQSALVDASHLTAGAINSRISQSSGQPDTGTGVWMSGYGANAGLAGNGNAAGIDYSTGGVLIGADGQLTPDLLAGVVAGYGRTNVQAGSAGSIDSNNYLLGLYGGTSWGNVAFRGGLINTWHDLSSERSVGFASFADALNATYNARTFEAFGELGYDIEMGTALFEPFVNLSHVRHSSDGFTENGGASALTVEGASLNTTFTTIGLRASTELTAGTLPVSLQGMVGWRHAFGETASDSNAGLAGASSFAVEGTSLARNVAVVEAGLNIDLSSSGKPGAANLSAVYSGSFGDDTNSHGVRLGLNVNF